MENIYERDTHFEDLCKIDAEGNPLAIKISDPFLDQVLPRMESIAKINKKIDSFFKRKKMTYGYANSQRMLGTLFKAKKISS